MKRRLSLVLALVLASFCSLQMQAERVAPTLPKGQTPQEGGCYWLYNVATGLFMGDRYVGSNVPVLTADGIDIYLSTVDDCWVLRKNSPEGYLLRCGNSSGSDNMYFNSTTSVYDECKFVFTPNEGSYKIAMKNNEDNELYLGYDSDREYMYGNLTENVDWLFMNATEASHYAAELKLYNALTAADSKGWGLGRYETIYDNRANATDLEMIQAAELLTQALENSVHTGIFDPLNECDMMLYYFGDLHPYWTGFTDDCLSLAIYDGKSATLTAEVETDQKGDLFYSVRYIGEWVSLKVYIDDVLVRTITPHLLFKLYSNDRIFDEISAGKHIVKWVFENTQPKNYGSDHYEYAHILNIGFAKTPLVAVNLAEPGSLGTEVLYNVNHVRDVHNLKVVGRMNADDVVRLSMMTNLMYLDLSEAALAELPAETFSNQNTPYLHDVILPEGMTSIGNSAFYQSNAERIVMPSTIKSIGNSAFESAMIKSINIPNATTSLGNSAFSDCYQLEDVHYSNSLTTIPYECFRNNIMLKTFEIHEGITSVEDFAFDGCKYGDFQPVLPTSLKKIGESAFSNCQQMKEIVIGDNVSNIRANAFGYCASLERAIISQNVYSFDYYSQYIFRECAALKDLTLRSSTLVKPDYGITDDEYRPNITLRVPQYLVNYYKLDPYWYNFGDIVGFSTADTKDWTIHADLTLDSHSRIEGEPNIELKEANLKIVGDLPMTIDDFTTNASWDEYACRIKKSSQILSGCDNISVLGNCYHNVTMGGQRWLCMTLPFDTKLGNIVPVTDDVLCSVRYYDGAERAANGVGGSWKRISNSEQVIPAGTGFIIQHSAANYYDDATIQFKSLENDSRNNILNNKDFEKSLEINASAEKANSGWNLVGNPYLTYYNIHKLNFTAPITVYDYDKDAYFAYSIADDDYALMPLQGFFVQCPGEEMQTISFPVSGKQFTAEITEQNAAKARVAEQNIRKIVDLTLSKGDVKDNTRIVFNESASSDYELNCDASKFMSGNKKNIQLWTLDEKGTAYAINERPMVDGVVALGVTIPSAGTYTFAATRCQAEGIILHDNETGIDTDLTQKEYVFDCSEGTYSNRFEIRSTSTEATGIENIANSDMNGMQTIFTIDGRLVKKADKFFNVQSLPQGAYIINSNGTTKKVIINK